jgi:OOP family OmpA-OmpF porin
VEVNEWGCEVELVFQNIQFEFDKYELMGKYMAVLNKVAKALKDDGKMALRLHGHTDWIGTEEYNLTLSQNRANAVKDYLVKKGVRANRLETVGHGECCPVAPNTTDEGRFKNRRVEFERIR